MLFSSSSTRRLIRLAATAACALALVAPAAAQTVGKKPVTSAADLPRFTYAVDIAPSALLQADAATFAPFAAKVRADIESVLAGYDIQDRGTLRDLLALELDLQVLSGTENAAALATIQQIRALEDKPDSKLVSGVVTGAIIAARTETGATSGPQFDAAFAKDYAAALAPLPWPVVGALLKQAKSTYETLTPAILIGQIAGSIDPAAAQSHALGNDTAALIIRSRFLINVILPERVQAAAVIGALVAQNTVQKPDIWAAREVTLHASDRLTPVRVGIWDSGSDVTLFPGQLYTDPAPKEFDAHGLAFDLLGFKTHGYLEPLTPEQRRSYPDVAQFLEGNSDLQESIDSPAATAVKKEMTSLTAAQVPAFFQNLSFMADYAHGTHVAGIALRGNPAARLVVGRITFDYKLIPTPPSEELERRGAKDYLIYVKYFRDHHVRVVNMSWGGTPAGVESALEKNNIGKDANERKALAAKLFAIDRAGLYAALKSAPEILFVCAAGNANSDSGFNETIPASFDLPNLLVVGAVDQAGDETSFTSYGKTVQVDADGYHVDSVIPGGMHVKLSGTSMASPNVANLAAKLIALDPKLTPAETIALIRDGSTASADGRRHNIYPKRSVELLRIKEEAAR